MSSHHIVREDQEPALLIMDAHAASLEQVQELLEWSPTVLVAEDAIPIVRSWGIKLDVVISLEEHDKTLRTDLLDQAPLKILTCRSAADLLSTALYFLIASKQQAVNILTAEPLEKMESFSLDISVFQSGKRWSFIRQGTFEKWLPAGSSLHVYPPHDRVISSADGIVTIQRNSGFWICEE